MLQEEQRKMKNAKNFQLFHTKHAQESHSTNIECKMELHICILLIMIVGICGFHPVIYQMNTPKTVCFFSSSSNWGTMSVTTNTEHFFFKDQTNVYSNDTTSTFYIRPAMKEDIPQIVEIEVDAFSNPSYDIRPYLVQSEIRRYMNNFPDDGHQDHAMFVAVSLKERKASGEEMIVGFVDLDDRVPLKMGPSEPPRPYLSDLAVHSHYRRKGIATSLLDTCEEQAKIWGHGNIYLRVEKHNNVKAKEMYFSKGYTYIPHEYFGVENLDDTLLLRLDLNIEENIQIYSYKVVTDETLVGLSV